jgi:isopentenyl-diphosphate delta-isomerase
MYRSKVILVDEDDMFVGVEDKLIAHKKGLLHRAFSVFVFKELGGKILTLIQKRAAGKYHSPGLWTNSCCSHPQPEDESLEDSASKRLFEEMGISIKLISVGSFVYKADLGVYIENELDYICIGKYNEEEIIPNPQEVSDYRWIDVDVLKEEVVLNPDEYTIWLNSALSIATKPENLEKLFSQ